MVLVLPPFPDIEAVLHALVQREVPALAGKVSTELPKGAVFPQARVARLGGRRTRLWDYPVVDIEVFAPGATGKPLLETIEAALFGYPGAVAVGSKFVKILDVQVRASLGRRPWEDDLVRRYAATYQLRVGRLGPNA